MPDDRYARLASGLVVEGQNRDCVDWSLTACGPFHLRQRAKLFRQDSPVQSQRAFFRISVQFTANGIAATAILTQRLGAAASKGVKAHELSMRLFVRRLRRNEFLILIDCGLVLTEVLVQCSEFFQKFLIRSPELISLARAPVGVEVLFQEVSVVERQGAFAFGNVTGAKGANR
jgi:hypothetical protein